MTVKELITQLMDLDPDLLIVASMDGEGNSFSPLSDIAVSRYLAESAWMGELVNEQDKEYYEEDGPEVWSDMVARSVPAVVFWPTN